MELAIIIIAALATLFLGNAVDNRWLRSNPRSRLGLSIAIGGSVFQLCVVGLLAFLAIRGIMRLV
jgi:hypothetical protein